MEWWMLLLFIVGGLLVLFATGMPVAFSFLLVNAAAGFMIMGGETALNHIASVIIDNLARFTLVPVVMFILMGEVMFLSGLASRMVDTLNKCLGVIPGRLSLLAVGAGTLFASMSGASMASVAVLGSSLVPEMEKHGYKKPMTLGPILGSSGLAVMIPPSALGVFLCAVAQISVGQFLIAIVVPGLVMAILYASYILIRCQLQPSLAPSYKVPPTPLLERIALVSRYVLPLGIIIVLVLGLIFLGVATPSESAALGALGTFLLAAVYWRLNWNLIKESILGTTRIAVMILMIFVGAISFSQILAFSGASRNLVELVTALPVPPIVLIFGMQFVTLLMGCFLESGSIIMITFPIFMPIVYASGFDPIWFAALMLLNLEMGLTTPPFGVNLFVMKGVAPPDTTTRDIYMATLPFLGCDLIVMMLMIAFPSLALWLPHMMK